MIILRNRWGSKYEGMLVTPIKEISIRLSGVAYVILKRAHLKSQYYSSMAQWVAQGSVKPWVPDSNSGAGAIKNLSAVIDLAIFIKDFL